MESALFYLYLFPLVFAPLAFGTIDPWAIALLEWSIFFTTAGFLLVRLRQQRACIQAPGLMPLLAFLGWIVVQLIPLPISLVALISPNTAALYAPLQAVDPNSISYIPLSVHPWYTLQEAFRFAAYIAYYFLTVQMLAESKRMRQTLLLVLSLAAGIALYGILQHYTGSDRIYWLRSFLHKPVGATFSYKNHYAAYLAMLLPIALALFFYYRPKHRSSGSLKQLLIDWLNNLLKTRSWFLGLYVLVFVLALLLSGSRAGVACAAIACTVMLIIGRKRFSIRGTSIAFLVIALTIMGTGLGIDGLSSMDQGLGTALDHDSLSLNGRIPFWKNAFTLVHDFPIVGTGAGTFRTIYPRTIEEIPKSVLPLHAHNEYLETLSTTGIVGTLLLLSFFIAYFRTTAMIFRQRKDGYVIHLYLGSLAGMIAYLLHSCIDLQFHISAAVGLSFVFLLGVHAASVTLKQHQGSRWTVTNYLLQGFRGWSTAGLVIGVGFLCFGAQLGELRALHLFPELAVQEARTGKAGYAERRDLLKIESIAANILSDNNAAQELYDRANLATHLSSLNPRYWYALSLSENSLELVDKALADAKWAIQLNPTQPLYLRYAAELLAHKGATNSSQTMFAAALANDPTDVQNFQAMIRFLLKNQQKDKALQLIAEFLAAQPEQASVLFTDIEAAGISASVIQGMLPQRVAAWIALGKWYERINEPEQAENSYMLALSNLEKEPSMHSSFFWSPLQFFQRQRNYPKAMLILQNAVVCLPKEVEFHLQLGDVYMQQGLAKKALDQYQFALQLKPENAKTQQRIDQTKLVLGQP